MDNLEPELKQLMERVAEEAAHKTANKVVREILVTLGIDSSDPIAIQKDMAALREMRGLIADKDFQSDMAHVRAWRESMEAAKSRGFLAIIALITTGAMGALWIGAKELLTK